jgi:ankyrin repeat protein
MSSFTIFDHGTTHGLYYDTSTATAIHSSEGDYLDIDASIPRGNLAPPLQYGLGLNEQGNDGTTLLHRATIDKSLDQVKTLLFDGAAIDVNDSSGYQPLHYAIISDHMEIFKLLLQFGADVNAKGRLGWSPIHLALSNKQMVDLLLQQGASVSSQDDKGDTALHLAFSNPSFNSGSNSVKYQLLSSEPDLNIANRAGLTPFHTLLEQEYHDDTLKCLALSIDLGADISHAFPDGKLPAQVFLARSKTPLSRNPCFIPVFKAFLAKGADPLTPLPNGLSLFIHFTRNDFRGYDQDLSMLHDLCRTVKIGPISEDGNSALHELSKLCRTTFNFNRAKLEEPVGTLLARGGDPNLRNLEGQTSLLLLLIKKAYSPATALRVMEKMLSFGADPMLQDLSGNCALQEAAKRCSVAQMTPLLRAAAEREGPWPELPGLSLHGQTWWRNWKQALDRGDWAQAKDAVAFHHGPRTKVELASYSILAERYLERARTTYEEDVYEPRRSYVAGILRDCRLQNVEIDQKYFDYLLELCE